MHKFIVIFLFLKTLLLISLTNFQEKEHQLTDAEKSSLIQQAEELIFHQPEYAMRIALDSEKQSRKDNNHFILIKSWYIQSLYHINSGNIQQAKGFAEKAIALSQEMKFDRLLVDAHLLMGEIVYNEGQFERSMKYFLDATKLSKKIRYKQGESFGLNMLGKYHYSKGNYSRSLNYFQEAMAIAKEIGNPDLQIKILNNIGKYFETHGLFKEALEKYLSGYDLIDSTKNKVIKATTYNHLGNIYDETGDYEQSLRFHKKALNLRKEINYVEGMAKSDKNIGEVFQKSNQLDSAEYYYQRSYNTCKAINYKKGKIKSLFLLGEIYHQTNRLNEAENAYLASVEESESIGYQKGNMKIYLNLGRLQKETGNPRKAEYYLKKGIESAREDTLNSMLEPLYREIAQVQTDLHNYQKSNEYLLKYVATKEYMLNHEKNENVEQLRIAFETDLKEKENKILQQENTLMALNMQRKNILILVTGLILVMLILFTLMTYQRVKSKELANLELETLNSHITQKNDQLAHLNKELDLSNNEKDKFFSIIAHELRNPLWWFKNLSETLSTRFNNGETDRVKMQKGLNSLNESAKTAFHLIDNLLQWSKSQLGRLTYQPKTFRMNELVRKTFNLFQPELESKNIRTRIDIQEDSMVYVDHEQINTVLRNLISNAIKYTPENGTIAVFSEKKDQFLRLCIQDNGIGISPGNQKKLFDPKIEYTTLGLYQEKGSGLGLLLCKDFVEMNGGNIRMESEEGKGTRFYFSVPLSTEKIPEPV